MPQWLELLPDNRLARVQEPAIAGKHFHLYPFKVELGTARNADFLCLGLLNLKAYTVSAKEKNILTAAGVDYTVRTTWK